MDDDLPFPQSRRDGCACRKSRIHPSALFSGHHSYGVASIPEDRGRIEATLVLRAGEAYRAIWGRDVAGVGAFTATGWAVTQCSLPPIALIVA